MKWKSLKALPEEQFRRITGIKKTTFYKLLEIIKPKWVARRKAGGPTPKLKMQDQLLLTLSYWRNYGTYLETGTKFKVSESTAFNICRFVEECLKLDKLLHLPGKKLLLSGNEDIQAVVFDVTECPIERPKQRKNKKRRKNIQKHYYSGKKKRHTIKEQVVVNQKSGIIIATNMDCGKTHDFKIYKKSKNHVHSKIKVQGDLGYQGLQKIHNNSELPKKRSKNKPLTKEDKQRNKKISSSRVIVENIFAYIKKFKIISQRYRNRRKRFGLRFNLICAIYNYERNA